jgi:aldose 1-epimerase
MSKGKAAMRVQEFGEMDGQIVYQFELRSAAGAVAKIISYGACVQDLVVPAGAGLSRVVLGFNNFADYRAHSPHFGAIAGRFANRIAHGRFSLDGKTYQLQLNEAGRQSLHGGHDGFGKRVWQMAAHDDRSVRLTLHSRDGDAGYPGTLDVECVYTLAEPATLRVELTARTDTATIVNLAHHSYFNLELGPLDRPMRGEPVPSVIDHILLLNADFYTPVDADLIPTGEILSVAGSAYDFRVPRPIRTAGGLNYDTNYVLTAGPDPVTGLAHVATVGAPTSGLVLGVHSTEPGVQLYDSASLAVPVPGLAGAHYGHHAGLCLEPQRFPDSPNRRHFTSAVLRSDNAYRQTTEYRFG